MLEWADRLLHMKVCVNVVCVYASNGSYVEVLQWGGVLADMGVGEGQDAV